MKALNYILALIILGLGIVLISNNISRNNVRKSNILEIQKRDSIINSQSNLINQFENAPAKIDTTIYLKFGNLQKVYHSSVKRYEKIIEILKSQKPDTIKIHESLFEFNTKIDSLINDDLFLKYKIETFGFVLKTDFDYKIKQKEIIKTKIIYEPKYIDVPKPYYEPRRSLDIFCTYGLTETHFSTGLMYGTKNRLKFGVAYNFTKFDENYQYVSFLIGYKIF